MFRDYALLGDDICIADSAVAKSYLSLMTDYGVDINLSKSLESDIGVSEFAKRLFKDEADLTPMPPKLITLLMSQFRALPTLVRDMVGRGLSVESLNLTPTRPFLSTSLPSLSSTTQCRFCIFYLLPQLDQLIPRLI
jgi:hypothetical protein